MAGKKKSIGFTFAIQGLKEVFRSEFNFRLHLLSTILVIAFGIYFNISMTEWIGIAIVIGFVLTAEVFNTAIEEVMNHIQPEIHPAAKKIKDIAAAGVFVASITAFIVGLLIFLPYIFE